MKMYFVKGENGEMILVTDPEEGKTYLDAEGNEVVCEKEVKLEAPAIQIPKAVEELTGLIKEMAENQKSTNEAIRDVKDQVDLTTQQLKAYEDAQKRGIVLPGGGVDRSQFGNEDQADLFAPYKMAEQGRRLQDKFAHPMHTITDEKREEMAKFFILFLKAGVFQNQAAMAEFRQRYGDVSKASATVIGDSGNVFPIPDIVEEEILHYAREQSVILQYGRLLPMTSEIHSWPKEASGSAVAWGNTTAESMPDVNTEFELTAYELSAYATAKNMTLADARSDIVSWLTEMMAEAVGQELDNAAFDGDGTSTYGYCSGLLSAAAGYSVVLASGSAAFSSIGVTALSEAISKVGGKKKIGARWFMNGEVFHFIRDLKDDNNRPIFYDVMGDGGSALPGTRILGYPYSEVPAAVSTSAVSTGFIVFGNLRNFGVGRRLDTMALHVDPYGLWTTNRTRFKIYNRWGLKIALENGFCRIVTAAS